MTHPSNLWNDLTVPFWSMPENTDHPTQKPEKLLAKIILASTNENDLILDPFAGSGTTAVVAKKLNRRFVGIEMDENYCILTEKRLEMAKKDKSIQGFSDGVFYERNTTATNKKVAAKNSRERSESRVYAALPAALRWRGTLKRGLRTHAEIDFILIKV